MNFLNRVALEYSRDPEFNPQELAEAIGSTVNTVKQYKNYLQKYGGEVAVAREAINEQSRLSKQRNR